MNRDITCRWCLLALLMLPFGSCKESVVKYHGMEDMFLGARQITLYEDGRFYFEPAAGGAEGNYTMNGDTIFLMYDEKHEGWPEKFLLKPDYFESLAFDGFYAGFKIKRWQ